MLEKKVAEKFSVPQSLEVPHAWCIHGIVSRLMGMECDK